MKATIRYKGGSKSIAAGKTDHDFTTNEIEVIGKKRWPTIDKEPKMPKGW